MRRRRSAVACLAMVSAAGLGWAATGSWTAVPTPNRGTIASGFYGVAGASDSEAWAVGHSYDTPSAAYRTLIERWDGARWTIVPSPNRGTDYNDLHGVAVEPTGAAWAVGYSRNPHAGMVLGWTGTAWRMSALPSLPGASILYAVAAAGTNAGWAVGWVNEVGRVIALTLHWNGAAWTRVAAALPKGTLSALSTVAAAGPDDVWAGGYSYANGRHRAFVEHWDGARWAKVPFPRSKAISYVSSLSALPSGEAWAAGEDNGVGHVARWDGLRWTTVPRPNVGTGRNVLSKIVARAPDDVWVAGYVSDPSAGNRMLIQHWNGAGWTTETAPDVGTYASLLGFTALPSGRLWAVGWTSGYDGDRTLAVATIR